MLTGKRNSPNFGHRCGIGKENDIRDYSDERNRECGTLVKKEWGMRDSREKGEEMRDSREKGVGNAGLL